MIGWEGRWYTDGQLKLTAASLRDFRLAGGTQPLYPLWQGLLLFKRLLTFPIGYCNDAAFLFYTGGSQGSLFLTDDSYHYISRYTSFLLQCRYQYRIPLSLSHKDSLVPVHHKHMDILYAGCSLLHWYRHWWKDPCLFYICLGAPSSPKKYGLSYHLFYRQEWHLSPADLLLMYNSLPEWQPVSPTDMKLIPAGRNTGIQPLHKGYRLWIKTILLTKEKLPLGLNDSDYYLEGCFQEIGCRISYSTRYYVAYVYLQPV